MKYLSLSLCIWFCVAISAFSQGTVGRWKAFEGERGEVIVVTLDKGGKGQARLTASFRELAVSYGEGSQFWRTFHTTGGYYFIVTGEKTCNLSWTYTQDSLKIRLNGNPADKVSVALDEEFSSRDLSEQGGYKEQVIAQWKRDIPYNEDVKKNTIAMQEHLRDFLGPVFEVLVEGDYSINCSRDSLILYNPDIGARYTWQRQD